MQFLRRCNADGQQSELMQIMNGLEVSSPIGDVLSEEGASKISGMTLIRLSVYKTERFPPQMIFCK